MAKSMEQIMEEQMQRFMEMKMNNTSSSPQQQTTSQQSFDIEDEDDDDIPQNTYSQPTQPYKPPTPTYSSNPLKPDMKRYTRPTPPTQEIKQPTTRPETDFKDSEYDYFCDVKQPVYEQIFEPDLQSILDNEQGFETMVSEPQTFIFNGRNIKYQRYSGNTTFETGLLLGDNISDNITNYKKLCDCIMKDIANMYGGLDRITNIGVFSDILMLNGTTYEPILPEEYISALPVDIQNYVKFGMFAWLFDFGKIREMKSLVEISFEDIDFVFHKVRTDIGYSRSITPSAFFRISKSLRYLYIGSNVVTRDTAKGITDTFDKPRRGYEMVEKLDNLMWDLTKSSWGSVKSIYQKPHSNNLLKVGKLVGMTSLATASTLGTASYKLGRFGAKLGSHAKNALGDFYSAYKENK